MGVTQLPQALERTPIVAVQNTFNIAGGGGAFAKRTNSVVDDPEGVLALCKRRRIALLPYSPLGSDAFGKPQPALDTAATTYSAAAARIALAWLLARSPVKLPIPGTCSIAHLEENWKARAIRPSQDMVADIAREARAREWTGIFVREWGTASSQKPLMMWLSDLGPPGLDASTPRGATAKSPLGRPVERPDRLYPQR